MNVVFYLDRMQQTRISTYLVFLNTFFLRRFLLVMKMRTHFTSPSATIKRLSCSSLLATLFGLAIFLLFPAIVSAHAEYVSSDPAANAVLKNAPTTITIHFSEGIDPKSTILVYDTTNHLVSQPAKIPNNNDLKTMAVALQPKGSELYVVDWYTISADDGHTDAGSFRFFVNPSSDLTDAVHASNPSGTNPAPNKYILIWGTSCVVSHCNRGRCPPCWRTYRRLLRWKTLTEKVKRCFLVNR